MTNEDRLAYIQKTADWLLANPDKACVGYYAKDALDYPTDPLSPAAECFCFVGRLVKEADIEPPPGSQRLHHRSVGAFLEPLGVTVNAVWGVFDSPILAAGLVSYWREPTVPERVTAVLKLFKKAAPDA